MKIEIYKCDHCDCEIIHKHGDLIKTISSNHFSLVINIGHDELRQGHFCSLECLKKRIDIKFNAENEKHDDS